MVAGCDHFETSRAELAVDASVAVDATSADAAVAPCTLGTLNSVLSTPIPFTTTGTTPAGSLDDVQFMSIRFVGGHCPGVYDLDLHRTNVDGDKAVARFSVMTPWDPTEPPTGTIAASGCVQNAKSEQGSFEIVHLDAPGPDATEPHVLRIAGRVTINMGGWNVDFTVDAMTTHYVCLLL